MILEGNAWVFGDDINTDVILPGKYLKFTSEQGAAHVMEGVDPTFAAKVQPGDIIVGGANFGCGSSRESAPGALKCAGVAAVVAIGFARIFYRNAINLGLPVLVCPDARQIREGSRIVVDVAGGEIRVPATGQCFAADSLPPLMLEMLLAGGLVPYLERKLRAAAPA